MSELAANDATTLVTADEAESVWQRAYREDARVTVAISLYNFRDYVVSCLESVQAQTLSTLDLVIVDDASADGSGRVAQTWLAEYGRRFGRVALLRHTQNKGLARARNTAFAHAETPYVFVLDCDNAIYPRCLERLASALDCTDASFAYCYLEFFGARRGLQNVSAWNPSRLREGNTIDAMVLFRRAAWAEAGGYATDMPHMGWEDFDMWFRLAKRHGWGVQVPEILARYCVRRDSMLHAVTMPNLSPLWHYLRERHPELFAPSPID